MGSARQYKNFQEGTQSTHNLTTMSFEGKKKEFVTIHYEYT